MRHSVLLWKVLRANISISQIVGYAVALLAGISIILIASALYADGIRLTEGGGGKPLLSDGVRVLSKEVSYSPLSLLSNNSGFSQSDIERLSSQQWVRSVAPFTTSDFDASIAADFGGAHFATALFFEAIPDEFYDSVPPDWGFDISEPAVQIILPADYLALYNFGFAPARGLPKLTEQLICQVPLRVAISGDNGQMIVLPARIVGFSKRLNTIAVPLDFLQWANQQFGSGKCDISHARLIIITKGGTEDEAAKYFRQHRIDATGGSESEARLTSLLRRFVGIIAAVGSVLCLLSLFIMYLSLRLLVTKNRLIIQNLRLLGYSTSAVTSRYRGLIILTNCAVFGIALIVLVASRNSWYDLLTSMGATPAPLSQTLILGVIIVFILTAASCLSLAKMISRNR